MKDIIKKNLYIIVTLGLFFVTYGIIYLAVDVFMYKDKKDAQLEKVEPYLDKVYITSNNKKNIFYAESGDIITVSIEANKNLSIPPKIILNDKELKVEGKNKNYKAEYQTTDEDIGKPVKLNIYDYKDVNNLYGKSVNYTTIQNCVTTVSYKGAVTNTQNRLQLSQNIVKVKKDKAKIITASINNSLINNAMYLTEDNNIVSINNGVIKGLSEGMTIIQVGANQSNNYILVYVEA